MSGENAAKRGRLFDLYVRQPGHEDATQGRYFWCPLCRHPFERQDTAGDNPRLTLAHIIPESLGGTLTTLTCARCNNGHGHEIEVDLLTRHQVTDWAAGRGTAPVRMGKRRKIRAESRRDPQSQRIAFDVHTPMANPEVQIQKEQLQAIEEGASGQSLKVTFRWFRPGWCWAAVCHSAYLLMFKYFGYDFVRNPRYNFIRDQILRPDEAGKSENILVLPPEIAEQFLEGSQAAVVFVREPMRAILACLRFRSPGGVNQVLAVAMPGPDEPPITTISLDGAVYSTVPDDPQFMSRQQGSLWLAWHQWLGS